MSEFLSMKSNRLQFINLQKTANETQCPFRLFPAIFISTMGYYLSDFTTPFHETVQLLQQSFSSLLQCICDNLSNKYRPTGCSQICCIIFYVPV